MTHIEISRSYANASALSKLKTKIIDWDYTTLHGEGVYRTLEKFGYIALEIRKDDDNYAPCTMDWNEKLIPLEFSTTIEELLSFFMSYVEALKGERITLKFKITDGAYHVVDSNYFAYQTAMIRALFDCFDCNEKDITKRDRNYIEQVKTQGTFYRFNS